MVLAFEDTFTFDVGEIDTLDVAAQRVTIGEVIEGMEVVDKIVSVQTGPQGEFRKDVPVIPIIIKKASRHSFE